MQWMRIYCLWGLLAAATVGNSVQAADVNSPEVQKAIHVGLEFLRDYDYQYKPAAGLITYTLLTGEDSVESPTVERGLQLIEEKFRLNPLDYHPESHHIYEAAVDILALEKADPVKYQPEIEAIINFVVESQEKHGGWFYPDRSETNNGDTSITQYAILALWAGYRAQVEIRQDVLVKAAQWHIKTQQNDGGFVYHPRPGQVRTKSSGTMTAAGSGSMGIISLMLYGTSQPNSELKSSRLKFGILEKVNRSGSQITTVSARQIRPEIQKSMKQAEDWLAERYPAESLAAHDGFQYYFFYTIERAAAVNAWTKIGVHDWFSIGSDVLIPKQGGTGYWPELPNRRNISPTGTCFSLLFLMRPTQKLVPKIQTNTRLGDGLLTGGRGLPENLENLEMENGKIRSGPMLGDLDQLLNGLSQITLDNDAQQQSEMKVNLEDPQKLIGNLSLLGQLSQHKDARVRQISAWALGKTDQIDGVKWLLPMLTDNDLDVAVEARFALCWISRRPTGWDHEPDPRVDVNFPDLVISEEQIKEWQKSVQTDWTQWYRKQRPYQLRDDLQDPDQKRFQKQKSR